MEDQIKKLVEQIITTEDLREVQSLAVELQCAVYGRIQQLQEKLAETSSIQSDDESVLEVSLDSNMLDGQQLQNTDETS